MPAEGNKLDRGRGGRLGMGRKERGDRAAYTRDSPLGWSAIRRGAIGCYWLGKLSICQALANPRRLGHTGRMTYSIDFYVQQYVFFVSGQAA